LGLSLENNQKESTPLRSWQVSLCLMVVCLLAVPLPAFAYGDPSGGALFQILAPIVALVWGAWMIFANKVYLHTRKFVRRIRGIKEEGPEAAPPEA
jgi:hypothetical protein